MTRPAVLGRCPLPALVVAWVALVPAAASAPENDDADCSEDSARASRLGVVSPPRVMKDATAIDRDSSHP